MEREKRDAGESRVDLNLRIINAFAGDLPEIAEEWDGLGSGERASLSIDWDDLMDRLETLEADFREGNLSAEQEARYTQLMAELKETLPIIERLGLRSPSEVL
jgi:hypothetical protein